MNPSARVVSIDALRDLHAALADFGAKSQEALGSAEIQVRRALREGSTTTGLVEQEIALRRAQQRLREAEDKLAVTRRWLVLLPEAVNQYHGPSRQLAGMLDSNLKQSLALLRGKIDSLEAYVAQAPPGPATAPVQPPPPPPPEERA
jgi:hypothetical protein